VAALAALAVAASALAGCGGAAAPAAGPTASMEIPDTIRVALATGPTNFDLWNNGCAPAVEMLSLFGGWVTSYGLRGQESGDPELAESVTESEDGLTWTVKLRPDVKFSDGSPLTAADLVANFERHMATPGIVAQPLARGLTRGEATFTAVDSSTMEIKLVQRVANLPLYMNGCWEWIAPAAALATDETKEQLWLNPVSAGPYKFEEIDLVNGRFVLGINEHYWGETPPVAKYVFTVVPEASTRLAQLKNGEVDYITDLPGTLIPQVTDDLRLDVANSFGSANSITVYAPSPVTGDERVRQAISKALDREQFGRVVYGSSDIYKPLSNIPWTTDGSPPVAEAEPRDLAGAKELLQGTVCQDGCTVRLLNSSSDWHTDSAIAVLQQQLAEVGITVQEVNVAGAKIVDALEEGEWELFWGGGGGVDPFTPTLQDLGYSYTQPTSYYFNDWESPEFAALAQKIVVATDDELGPLIEQANDLFGQGIAPTIPVTTWTRLNASRLPESIITNYRTYLVVPS
jgi:peptide/nickel transport system substrate-binding protein